MWIFQISLARSFEKTEVKFVDGAAASSPESPFALEARVIEDKYLGAR
jgi:hypothetical protein